MMHRIFDHDDEPLYGRKDCEIRLKPFRVSVMKEILHDYNPDYTPEDLLCLYMLTGGGEVCGAADGCRSHQP